MKYNKLKKEHEDNYSRINNDNKQRIEAFTRAATELLQKRNARYTDLNGFFEKAATFLKSDRVEKYEKWLYCNTDGVHDLGSGKPRKVQCELLPKGVITYFTGCRPDFACLDGRERKHLQEPVDFIGLFKERIRK